MVVKMMRWRPWPPHVSRKYEVKLNVQRLDWVSEKDDGGGLVVEIRWKGPRNSIRSFRRTMKRNCTREETCKRIEENDSVSVEWDEDFFNVCTLSGYKDNVFTPWEINFTVLHVSFR